MDTSALISLKHIVRSYQNEVGNYAPSQYKRLMNIAIEGLSDLNIFYAPAYKVAYYTVSDLNTVDVSADYVDYMRIGVIEDGQIWELTRNTELPIPNTISCGVDVGDTSNMIGEEKPWDSHYSFTGGYNTGYYRFDQEKRRLVFRGDMVGRQIVLEYITSGVSLSGNTYVPRQAAEVLKDYMGWKSIQRVEDVAENKKEVARRNYYISLNKYQTREFSFTMDELLDAIRSGQKQTIKR